MNFDECSPYIFYFYFLMSLLHKYFMIPRLVLKFMIILAT